MRFLKKIFGRQREMERIETLGRIFPYSRAEDMARVFELGRIHALRQLKAQLYAGLGTLALIVTIGGYFLVQDYLQLKVNYIVESRVEREIDKRIENFSKFYSYAKETIPLSILVQRASNDSREAFYKLLDMSKTLEPPLKELAEGAISNIIANLALDIGSHIGYQQDPALTVSDPIDIDAYRKTRSWMYRVAFLESVSTSNQISKRTIYDFVAYVLEKDESLRAVEAARQILQEVARIGGDVRDVDKYIEWWKRNRAQY